MQSGKSIGDNSKTRSKGFKIRVNDLRRPGRYDLGEPSGQYLPPEYYSKYIIAVSRFPEI